MPMLTKMATHFFLVIVICLIQTSVVMAGNDFVIVDMRTDLTELTQAWDYKAWISSTQLSNGNHPGGFTSGWLSIDLDNQPGLYGAKFTQVGIMTDPARGLFWFAFSEEPIECLQGTYYWWHADQSRYFGCRGDPNDHVELQEWSAVELVTYGQGFWIARVYDKLGNGLDVARITTNKTTIFDALVVMEEGYSETADPYMLGSFFFWHPQYMISGQGFQEWKASLGGINNVLYVTNDQGSNVFCPQFYGANINLFGDPRYWYGGSGWIVCSANMFSYQHFLPCVANN